MLRTSQSDSQRSELPALRRTGLPAVYRDRLVVVLMPAAGWSAPDTARHPGRRPHTVRSALEGFAARGTEAFHPGGPGPDPGRDRRAAVAGQLCGLVGPERTRTARRWAGALGPGIGVGHRQARTSRPTKAARPGLAKPGICP